MQSSSNIKMKIKKSLWITEVRQGSKGSSPGRK
jgi:hypothetical protein